jgi:hypothetical protein
MERLINSDSTGTQLWGPFTIRNPEDGCHMLYETSLPNRVIR